MGHGTSRIDDVAAADSSLRPSGPVGRGGQRSGVAGSRVSVRRSRIRRDSPFLRSTRSVALAGDAACALELGAVYRAWGGECKGMPTAADRGVCVFAPAPILTL